MFGIPTEPCFYFQAPVIELSARGLYLADVCHGVHGACRDGPGPDARLHRIDGFDHYLQQVWTAILALIAGMFLNGRGFDGIRYPSVSTAGTCSSWPECYPAGRTDIWVLVMRSIAKRPLLGYGYYAFWQGLKGESGNIIVAAHWVFGYAHNGVLEIWLQLGLVGTALSFVTLFQAIEKCLVLPSQWLLPGR